jgi:hypothetical protein
MAEEGLADEQLKRQQEEVQHLWQGVHRALVYTQVGGISF